MRKSEEVAGALPGRELARKQLHLMLKSTPRSFNLVHVTILSWTAAEAKLHLHSWQTTYFIAKNNY